MEVILGLGIVAVALMALASVAGSATRASQKGMGRSTAVMVAERQLTRHIQLAQNDSPAGAKALFWDAEYPYPNIALATGQEPVGPVNFNYALYANTVRDPGGVALGGPVANNRLKKVDIVVWWWSETGTRQGYGQLQYQTSRVVSEQGE